MPATKEKWYQRLGHIHNNNLNQMLKLANRIWFSKKNVNTKPDFYEACTWSTHYKVHNEKTSVDITYKPRVCLNADLFDGKNILLAIGNYRYETILTDEAIQMRFSMTMQSKNIICDESKHFFRKIETLMGRKIQYFQSDNAREYQLLVLYFEKKNIIWKKSTCYALDQDKIAQCSICRFI